MNKDIKEFKEIVKDIAKSSIELKRENLFLKISLNNNKNYVYVVNNQTKEIVFINDVLEKLVGDVLGNKCYDAFSGYIHECEHCNSQKLKINKPYTWVHFNTKLNKLFYIIDVLKVIDGIEYIFEKATDITDQVKELKNIIEKFNL